MDITDSHTDSRTRRPHAIDELISPALRNRLGELDPLLNLDRVVRLVIRQRVARSAGGVA